MEMEKESSSEKERNDGRLPLSEVVSDCVKRWFKDALKEAKAGDINMQVLVGQMYFSGYGVPRDAQRGRIWITRASKTRSFWKVSDKHPGYNASDSDSDEQKGDS
ncbi:Eukaryotic elongation factor 2 kinase [Trema orientale]|uniref:Eukaryotic elongation factor 2 kinase n=1 Tax=Trema orientale TaxID=63057 RepID=A0A2P5F9A1_TREOI|nr:Eukaryotic elongation factor 2 kinase [Trema orientale]